MDMDNYIMHLRLSIFKYPKAINKSYLNFTNHHANKAIYGYPPYLNGPLYVTKAIIVYFLKL
jgi:hypothetical protein